MLYPAELQAQPIQLQPVKTAEKTRLAAFPYCFFYPRQCRNERQRCRNVPSFRGRRRTRQRWSATRQRSQITCGFGSAASSYGAVWRTAQLRCGLLRTRRRRKGVHLSRAPVGGGDVVARTCGKWRMGKGPVAPRLQPASIAHDLARRANVAGPREHFDLKR